MKSIKFLFISSSSVAGALLGIVAGLGLMTYLNLFTYRLWLDGAILLSIVLGFAFSGFKLSRTLIRT
jgi:hypothetical protein